jgi:hypothetical protein
LCTTIYLSVTYTPDCNAHVHAHDIMPSAHYSFLVSCFWLLVFSFPQPHMQLVNGILMHVSI